MTACSESSVDPTQRLKEMMDKKLGPIKDLGNITPLEFHYGLIPNDGLSRKTVYDNLILVGDSAGQANPLVLEGIRYAIMFGRVAGEVAADAGGLLTKLSVCIELFPGRLQLIQEAGSGLYAIA